MLTQLGLSIFDPHLGWNNPALFRVQLVWLIYNFISDSAYREEEDSDYLLSNNHFNMFLWREDWCSVTRVMLFSAEEIKVVIK